MVRQPPTAPPTEILIQDAIYAALAMTDDFSEPSREPSRSDTRALRMHASMQVRVRPRLACNDLTKVAQQANNMRRIRFSHRKELIPSSVIRARLGKPFLRSASVRLFSTSFARLFAAVCRQSAPVHSFSNRTFKQHSRINLLACRPNRASSRPNGQP